MSRAKVYYLSISPFALQSSPSQQFRQQPVDFQTFALIFNYLYFKIPKVTEQDIPIA